MQDVPLDFSYNGRQMKGFAVPLLHSMQDKPTAFDIIIDKAFMGTLRFNGKHWRMDAVQDTGLVDLIGHQILGWYAQDLPRIPVL